MFVKLIKTGLSYLFYYLGDGISRLMPLANKCSPLDHFLYYAGFYKMYQVFMQWSWKLDTEEKVWTRIDANKENQND